MRLFFCLRGTFRCFGELFAEFIFGYPSTILVLSYGIERTLVTRQLMR